MRSYCLLYNVLLNLHIFPVMNKHCTEPYLGPLYTSYIYIYTDKNHRSLFLRVKSLNEFSSLEQYQYHQYVKKVFKGFTPVWSLDVQPVSPCNFYLLSVYIMTYNTRFVFQTKIKAA